MEITLKFFRLEPVLFIEKPTDHPRKLIITSEGTGSNY